MAASTSKCETSNLPAQLDESDLEYLSSEDEYNPEQDVASQNTSDEDYDADTDDDVAEPQPSTKKKDASKKRSYNFKKSDTFSSRFSQHPVLSDPPVLDKTSLESFKAYLNDDTFKTIADLTNQYHAQNHGKSLCTTMAEIKKFFGMSLIMGCINMKRLRMYWSKKTRVPIIANSMSRTRFFKIRNNLKVVDNFSVNEHEKKADRLWKVRPLVEQIRTACTQVARGDKVSIDEQMIFFTGRCPARQYVPRKPSPTGLKNFVLAIPSGMVLDFEIYQGENTFKDYKLDDGSGGQGVGAVLRLTKDVVQGSHVFCDRFFTTIPLIDCLAKKDISLTGTVSLKNVPVTFSADKVMKKKDRGAMEQFVSANQKDEQISIIKWFDNKSILIASSLHGLEPRDECRRWCKKTKSFLTAPRPAAVREYNKSMGEVDLCDQMVSYHRFTARSKRWPIRVIMHLTDVAVNNCWLEYRRNNTGSKIMQLYDYRFLLREQLIDDAWDSSSSSDDPDDTPRQYRQVVPLPTQKSREKGAKHLPMAMRLKNSARCRREDCKIKTSVKCVHCDVFLCTVPDRNCFLDFHN
ncbi:piggyBac transposable element-derived protein 3-like [Watersipora subatra]|uniref:piggyBac transposable element-derived protein 3-like n=1 Tax=Watersipora subatra TaxID=2589382 RepID=UPI00355B2B72